VEGDGCGVGMADGVVDRFEGGEQQAAAQGWADGEVGQVIGQVEAAANSGGAQDLLGLIHQAGGERREIIRLGVGDPDEVAERVDGVGGARLQRLQWIRLLRSCGVGAEGLIAEQGDFGEPGPEAIVEIAGEASPFLLDGG